MPPEIDRKAVMDKVRAKKPLSVEEIRFMAVEIIRSTSDSIEERYVGFVNLFVELCDRMLGVRELVFDAMRGLVQGSEDVKRRLGEVEAALGVGAPPPQAVESEVPNVESPVQAEPPPLVELPPQVAAELARVERERAAEEEARQEVPAAPAPKPSPAGKGRAKGAPQGGG